MQLLSWNGSKHLDACLGSLLQQTFTDFELLVLDNASTDGSVVIVEEALKNASRPFRFIKVKKNLGFAGGHNFLFSLSNNEYVFCVNQDVVLADDYLEHLVAFLDKHRDAGSVAGVLKHGDGVIDTAGLSKNWYEKVSDITVLPTENECRVFGVSGALPLYRRAAVIEVSPDGKIFDETFFAYKEDVDLAWRLGRFGWGSFVVVASVALHERGFGQDKKWNASHFTRQRLSSRNHLLMLVKNLSGSDLFLVPAVILYELGKLVYTAVFVPKALGYVTDFIRLLPETIKIRKVLAGRLKIKEKHG